MDSSPFEENPRPNANPNSNGTSHKRIPSGRTQNTGRLQPTYDFIAPSPSPSPSSAARFSPAPIATRSALGDSDAKPDLRSELNSVRYELEVQREERQLEKLRHEQEIRALEKKIEEQAKRMDEVEADKRFLVDKQKELSSTVQKAENEALAQKQELDKQVRKLRSENVELRDEISEKKEDANALRRDLDRSQKQADTRVAALTDVSDDLREELEMKTRTLEELHKKLSDRDSEVQDLETELLRVKTQVGDQETLKVLKKELSEQVNHLRTLEATNRRQSNEIKTLRESMRSLEVVEEEKRALQSKLEQMEELRREFSEAQVRISVLQDQRNAWESYFKGENLEFDSPEAMAKALVKERLERAALIEKAGRGASDSTRNETLVRELRDKVQAMKEEVGTLKDALDKDTKQRQRIERQRRLALREVEFLRAQLQTFSTEETVFMQGNFDEQKAKRIEELEELLESYKKELEDQRATNSSVPQEIQTGSKRPREEVNDERIGEMARRIRQLQNENAELQRREVLSQKENEALQHRLSSMEGTATRILQLRNNPTSQVEAIKMETLETLRKENSALLAQLDSRLDEMGQVVPKSTADNLRSDIKSMEKIVAEKEKRMTRLKEIWSAKSQEFREAVYSLLGWKLDFLPNGRVRVTHMFAGKEDQSIEFDGEKGTMKISGGPSSMWAKEIRNQCSFWMARNSIPCLLASILIEQYEKTTRAQM